MNKPASCLLAPVVLLGIAAEKARPMAMPQTSTFDSSSAGSCTPRWSPTFGGQPGTNDRVRALTVFDDGHGGPALFVGGTFTSAGGIAADRIARWDGTRWSSLSSATSGGAPFGPSVDALAVFDDGTGGGPALYAAGAFTNIGSTLGGVSVNSIAKWNGTSWSRLAGGLRSTVHALIVFDDGGGSGPALFAGGDFDVAGGYFPAQGFAKWDGAWWSAPAGVLNGAIHCFAVFDDGKGSGPALYAAGSFAGAGSVWANRIAKWDGTSWSPLGSGLDNQVFSLAVFDDGTGSGSALFAGGSFQSAGGVPASRIAKWDGTSWSAVGSGMNAYVDTLAVLDDPGGSGPALYAGGSFTSAGGIAANRIAKWDGVTWSSVEDGISGPGSPVVSALAAFDDGRGPGPSLYAGGRFSSSGGALASNLARWDSRRWSALGNGLDDTVQALTVSHDPEGKSVLYAGGCFQGAGGAVVDSVAKWDGSSWSALGAGMNGCIESLTMFDDGLGAGPALIAGGGFFTAGGLATNHIASWNGTSWSALGSGVFGGTFYTTVCALAVFDDGGGSALYAGGRFAFAGGSSANNIAKWDGAKWSPLGSGVSGGEVETLTVFDDGGGPALFAGGTFTSAGGAPIFFIAKWDGASWSALGSGVNSHVFALVDHGTEGVLYASGTFSRAGGTSAQRIAKWDGSEWSALGSGAYQPYRALAFFDDGRGQGPSLYAGGTGLSKWDGSNWEQLGYGLGGSRTPGDSIHALAVFEEQAGVGPALCVGGGFTFSPSGDSFLAKWGCGSPTPVSLFCTAKTTLTCGPAELSAEGFSSATAASGFVLRAEPVRGCRAGLLLYSEQAIRQAVSFGGIGNGLLCLSATGLHRAGPIESGGTTPRACDGVLSIDMNRFRMLGWSSSGCNPASIPTIPAGFLTNPGSAVHAQMWARDSLTTGQLVTEGIRWTIGP